MASPSPPALTVVYAFSVLFFYCLQLLGADDTDAQAPQRGLERLAATAIFPAVLMTLVLTPLLAFAHVRDLGRGGAGGRLMAVLAKATFVAATLALACAVLQPGADAVVQIGADGHLDRGRGDVARLNIK